jgi:hypothetical protein
MLYMLEDYLFHVLCFFLQLTTQRLQVKPTDNEKRKCLLFLIHNDER